MRLEVAKENPDATLRVPHPRLAGGGEILREPRLRFRVSLFLSGWRNHQCVLACVR